MSEENVENIRRAIEAFNRGDADAFVALARPDVEWEDAVFWSEGTKVYRGREGLRDWFAQVREPWESIQVAVEEILEAGFTGWWSDSGSPHEVGAAALRHGKKRGR